MAPETVLKTVGQFIKRVEELGISVQSAYLFGSWAQGRATEWSDIDLAIISSAFEGVKFYDRRKVDQALLDVDTGVDVHPYRPEDFTEDNPFVREILRTGIRVV